MNLPVKVYRFSLCLSVFLPSSHHSWHPYCGCRGRRRVWQLPDVQQRGAEIPRRLQDTQRGWWWWVHPTTTAASCSSLPAVWSHCAHLLSWLCHPACACHIFRVHRCYLDHNDHISFLTGGDPSLSCSFHLIHSYAVCEREQGWTALRAPSSIRLLKLKRPHFCLRTS